ncbi:MAG: hypothetical protein HY472_00565 [Candidatus Sungbacteria bacterium]|nr:hypothetical protein [Candidatus Sungbacteria bacterium]
MDAETVKNEIRACIERMGFADELEDIEVHGGGANRFSLRIRNAALPEEDDLRRPPETNMLIGERGATLAAFEFVIKRVLAKKYPGEEAYKFTVDINDYRMRQLEDLKQDVKSAARAVRMYKKEVPLRSMTSFERRIVHLLLEEYPDIMTESVGQEPDRRVVIKPYP